VSHDVLALVWFALPGVLLIGYAILDGFDLGVGILHPFAKGDTERRTMMNSIGPLWDGNEVWLVTFGGALFAAFPNAYATVFSGFYGAFMLLLFALIFRAVSLEFRSKVTDRRWRTLWDFGFFASSLLAPFLFGVAAGNVMTGIAVDDRFVVHNGMLGQLKPYPIAVGVLTVCLFAMHGAIFVYLKTEGDLQERARGWIWRAFWCFLVAYLGVTAYTVAEVPRALSNFERFPALWIVPLLNVLAIANIPRAMHLKMPFYAFVSSCCTIAALAFLFAVALFPNLVPSTIDPAYGLTVYNARSSEKTLGIMLVVAAVGMPCVLAYTATIYWVFRGKVKLDHSSY
jgi:cytochrome d ubiquinol oxidase subunit II